MLTDLYSTATGIETTPSQLLQAGERISNLQRMFKVREGATRQDDIPSKAVFEQSLEANDGHVYPPVSKDLVNNLLDGYYQARGWDVTNGRHTKDGLMKLGMKFAIADLENSK